MLEKTENCFGKLSVKLNTGEELLGDVHRDLHAHLKNNFYLTTTKISQENGLMEEERARAAS